MKNFNELVGAFCEVSSHKHDVQDDQMYNQIHDVVTLKDISTTTSDAVDKAVNSPSHYADKWVEEIVVMVNNFGWSNVAMYCRINADKYNHRAGKKDLLLQDLKKLRWYVNMSVELNEKKDMWLPEKLIEIGEKSKKFIGDR